MVDSWFFMSSTQPMMWLLIVYLCSVKLFLPRIMMKRKAFDLKTTTRTYNLIQVLACAWSIREYYKHGFTIPKALDCKKFLSDEQYVNVLGVCWFCLITRIFELIEAHLFILRKKFNQVSLFHLYHHISSILIVWITLKLDGRNDEQVSKLNSRELTILISEMFWLAGGVINCAVHVVMYSYYFLSTFPSLKRITNSVKYMVTTLQIVQLIIFAIFALHVYFRTDCKSDLYTAGAINLLILLVFFVRFYYVNYRKKTVWTNNC